MKFFGASNCRGSMGAGSGGGGGHGGHRPPQFLGLGGHKGHHEMVPALAGH